MQRSLDHRRAPRAGFAVHADTPHQVDQALAQVPVECCLAGQVLQHARQVRCGLLQFYPRATFPMLRVASPLVDPSLLSFMRIGVATLAFLLFMRWVGQR